jgi:hypothetical protein
MLTNVAITDVQHLCNRIQHIGLPTFFQSDPSNKNKYKEKLR